MMRHPIEVEISRLRRRARMLWLGYALARTVAVVLLVVAIVVVCDYAFRVRDPGLRYIFSGLIVAAAGGCLVRYLWQAWRAPLTDIDVAQRVERRFPELADRLSSTIDFLSHAETPEAVAESASMRQSVVDAATRDAAKYELADAIDTRPARRAAGFALCVVAIFVSLAIWQPTLARIGAARLAAPWGGMAWPKTNHLQIVEPVDRLAIGEPFRIEITDSKGNPLPDDGQILYRYEGDEAIVSEALHWVDDRLAAHKPAVSRPFDYRVVGGDDDEMGWHHLDVLEPPQIDSLDITLHFPEYLSRHPVESERHVRAWIGTRVVFQGSATKPLTAATLHRDGEEPLPAIVGDDGYTFQIPLDGEHPVVVEKSGAYWFELTGRDGVIDDGMRSRYEIRAIEDNPPTVTIDEPDGNKFVTATAAVPLAISIKDDLGIRDAALGYLRSDRSEEGEMLVAIGGPPADQPPQIADDALLEARGDRKTIEHVWDLSRLGISAPAQITFQAIAHDFRPQAGRSYSRKLLIITPEELEERIAERQRLILNELHRVLTLQQQTRGQTDNLAIGIRETGNVESADRDQLQSAELSQRQIERTLVGPDEGVAAQVGELIGDLQANQVDNPEMARRMAQLAEELRRLEAEPLPEIARAITQARKHAQSSDETTDGDQEANPDELLNELAHAKRGQDDVIDTLSRIASELSQWDNYRRFARDVASLRRQQGDIAEATSEIGRETLSKPLDQLTDQQRAELKKLGNEQQDLARQFQRTQQQMQDMRDQLAEDDPLAAETLSDALEQSRERGVARQMQDASGKVSSNRLGQASQQQRQALDDLQEMVDILANRREYELSRLVKKLREAEAELAEIRAEQRGLQKKMDAAAELPEQERRRELERLGREQEQLAKKADRFARRLQRLQADEASRTASRGAGRAAEAGEQGQQGDQQGASSAAAAAEKDLAEAQQQLAQRRKQAELDLAMEQLAKIEDRLKSLLELQTGVISEIDRLEGLRQEQGRWTRGQAQSVRAAADDQAALADDTGALAEKIETAAVFHLALDRASSDMDDAADGMRKRETGMPTRRSAQKALRRLAQLIAALAPDPQAKTDSKPQQSPAGQGGASQANQDGIADLAQLKLIKLMQLELNERTRELDVSIDSSEGATPDELEQYAVISVEQETLAELLFELTKPSEPDPENDPDNLPDLRLDELDESLIDLLDGLLENRSDEPVETESEVIP